MLSSTYVGCPIDNVSVNNISYADDMLLLSTSVKGLRKLLCKCEAYAMQHGLRYNEKKSEFLLFKDKIKEPAYVPPIFLNGVPLRRVAQFMYLGHTEDLKDNKDIKKEHRALCDVSSRSETYARQSLLPEFLHVCSMVQLYAETYGDLRVQ
ncbi:uncharacterized protein LOC113238071 [Hyposmocoma kahamanoa]|uniref:uncharacterized protein LOC113238071 n=1 Tax=Hyposmocoma kahamanoa TaxID=1477025 RepID=UPI000E6D9253|nr:uncharacterized protein LOC113238071 [Hyposmocoma kahamanoa]